MQNFKFQPDLITWHKEGTGVYVSNCGLQKCTKINPNTNSWLPSIRVTLDADWQDSKWTFSALHAAQDECRRML